MAIAAVMVVSFLLMGLMVVSMSTGERSMRSSARDRNSEMALAVAEAGVQEAMARIEATGGNGFPRLGTSSPRSGQWGATSSAGPER
jgi:Tfp pilus assembly protein PilX